MEILNKFSNDVVSIAKPISGDPGVYTVHDGAKDPEKATSSDGSRLTRSI